MTRAPLGGALREQYISYSTSLSIIWVGGSFSDLHSPTSCTEEYEERVWDLETLEPMHMLWQSAGQCVFALASDGEEVWAAVGKEVVV